MEFRVCKAIFNLRAGRDQRVHMPRGSRVLHVGADAVGNWSLWFLCDPSQPLVWRVLRCVFTAEPMPGYDVWDPRKAYVGTVVDAGDARVYHVFLTEDPQA